MIVVSGPRMVSVLEDSNNLLFSRSAGAETSLVVGEDVVGFKVELDSACDNGFKDFRHGAEKGDRAVVRVRLGDWFLGKDNGERSLPCLRKVGG